MPSFTGERGGDVPIEGDELAEGDLLERPATCRDVGDAMAIVGLSAFFQNLSIVGALSERQAIEPLAVARWAEFFAARAGREGVSRNLGDFARALRELTAAPGESTTRQ